MNKIKRFFSEIRNSWNAIDLLPGGPHNFFKRIWILCDMLWSIVAYGALADDYISLGFRDKSCAERKKYVTSGNKRLFFREFYDDDARNVLAHKNLFSKRFSKFVTRDWIYTADSDEESVRAFFKNHDSIVVKPIDSTWGKGISVKSKDDVEEVLHSMKHGSHFMLEEKIVNHPDIAKLNPESLQTLRVETCLDSKGNFHLLNVLLMIGTKSTIVSNCHSGGVMCHINMETGKVDKPGFNPQGYWLDVHPVSNITFVGYDVPLIDKLTDYIKTVCQVMPNARYVGWDVAVTPTGFELIEGNFCPGQCTQTCDGIPKYDMLKSYL